jgi:hypothetical protein
VAQSGQIKRFYYYQMRGSPDNEKEGSFDSGLLDPPKTEASESTSETPKLRSIYGIYKKKTTG